MKEVKGEDRKEEEGEIRRKEKRKSFERKTQEHLRTWGSQAVGLWEGALWACMSAHM